jgi:TetR/AcrR family transcriptional regulator, repressor for neighboring sulfatase
MPRHLRRRRRAPEVARTELLDAAERVFAKSPPDQVGLKDVAKAAGTSHGLITHYFGTYDGLIAAALIRRTTALRERVFVALQDPANLTKPETLVDMLFDVYQDPVHLRLMNHLIAVESPDSAHALSLQHRGIEQVAARIADALRPQGSTQAYRDSIALGLMLAVAAAFGYAATRHSLAGAIGKPVTVELDRDVRRTLAQMVQRYILGGEVS